MLTRPCALYQVLLPSRGDVPGGQGLLQQLDLVPAFSLFRELLQVRKAGKRGRACSGDTVPQVQRKLVGSQCQD